MIAFSRDTAELMEFIFLCVGLLKNITYPVENIKSTFRQLNLVFLPSSDIVT